MGAFLWELLVFEVCILIGQERQETRATELNPLHLPHGFEAENRAPYHSAATTESTMSGTKRSSSSSEMSLTLTHLDAPNVQPIVPTRLAVLS